MGKRIFEMTEIIYPVPGKKDQLMKAITEACKMDFITALELEYCLNTGGIPKDLMLRIKASMDAFEALFKNFDSNNLKN